MLRRTTLRYFTSARFGGRLLTTTSSSTTTRRASTTPTPKSASTPPSTSTPTSQSSEYTAGTIKPAQQWHQKTDGSSNSGSTSGGGSGRRPSRGGQNLSARYARLENAVRGKQARAEAQAVNVSGAAAAVAATSTAIGTAIATDAAGKASVATTDTVHLKMGKPVEMFRGLAVPEEPKPPADDECCMSGCAVCVYDLHEEELEAYEGALTTLRASLVALGVSQAEWPARVRPASASQSASTLSPSSTVNGQANSSATTQSQDKSRKGAVLSAFEEMERKLAEKHRGEAQAEVDAGSKTGAETSAGISAEPGRDREEKPGVQAQAVASISPGGRKLDQGVNTTAVPHWRERQQLAAKTQQAARRRTFWTELYEGVRWALFSNR